jgi:hypothetical protein
MSTFIVVRDPAEARTSGWTNTVKNWYDDRAEARAEAERLCQSSGKRFVVFEAVAYVQPAGVPLEWRDGDPYELPF